MKFGKNLALNQSPEWSAAYIDYNGLKRLIKHAEGEGEVNEDGIVELAGISKTFFIDIIHYLLI